MIRHSKLRHKLPIFVGSLLMLLGPDHSHGAAVRPFSLLPFTSDPASAITISPDGRSAAFSEATGVSAVRLIINPRLGDEDVLRNAARLEFSVEFTEAPGNDDFFDIRLFDADTNRTLERTTFFGFAEAGQSVILRSGLNQGLEFVLGRNDQQFGTTARIFDMSIVVPLPSSLLLFLSGMLAMLPRTAPAALFKRCVFR